MQTAANERISDPLDHSGPFALRHLLAGLQAGVVGALVIVACLMIGSLWQGRSVWVAPNLFATSFFGIEAYQNGFLRSSLTGVALIIVVYGILGAVWGGFWRSGPRRWMRLYGAIAGFCVYLVIYGPLSRHINPFFTLYAPERQLEVGNVLWGIVLARSPIYARRIAKSTRRGQPPPPGGGTPQELTEQPVKSGEVIL